MGSESTLAGRLRNCVNDAPGRNHMTRIENGVELGTPDTNGRVFGIDFWLELKHVHEWPKRKTTPVRLNHFTAEQRQWLLQRGLAGGTCGVLLQVKNEYFAFNWFKSQRLSTLTRDELMAAACWHQHVLDLSFLQCISEVEYDLVQRQ